jgi:hypothetical protein
MYLQTLCTYLQTTLLGMHLQTALLGTYLQTASLGAYLQITLLVAYLQIASSVVYFQCILVFLMIISLHLKIKSLYLRDLVKILIPKSNAKESAEQMTSNV